MKTEYHLIWFDFGDSYFSEHKKANWNLVDYYENGIKQNDEKKTKALEEMVNRANHNVWEVNNFEGTRQTKKFCEEMEQALQDKKDFEIYFGFIRLKEVLNEN